MRMANTSPMIIVAAFMGMCISILFLPEACGKGPSPSLADLEYCKAQNTIFAKELESVFDNEAPAYHSSERKTALYLTDALTHSPSPHADCLKDLFLNRYKKALAGIKGTRVETGAVIWNVYNLSYVVKTKEVTVAFDLIRLPESLRKHDAGGLYKNLAKEMAGLCDILFVSHIHGDHADAFVAGEFIEQNKQVIAPPDVFAEEGFYKKVTHWAADGEEKKLFLPAKNTEILLRIYPGHQAIAADQAVDNNFTVLTFPNHITVAHSGDQCWEDDFTWIDPVHHDVAIDVLMVNTWTLHPDRLIAGLQPKVILPGHINEMGHDVKGREPFWKSYLSWPTEKSEVIHLFWAEPYRIDKPDAPAKPPAAFLKKRALSCFHSNGLPL